MIFTLVVALLGSSAVRGDTLSEPPAPVTMMVKCDTPLHATSPRLWGIFFEEINHAGEGGLYAELIRNRTFDEPGTGADVPGWALITPSDRALAEGEWALDDTFPQNPRAGRSLRLRVNTPGAVSVSNSGYWGIAVSAGQPLVLRLDAKRSGGAHESLDISIRSRAGETLARATIVIAETWGRHEVELAPQAQDAEARLVLTVTRRAGAPSPADVWLDTVSLFPKATWNGRRFGLRKDLAQLVADLRPAFVRFPGGCYVEGGDNLRDAFRWEETLGDISTRPGHMNANWGYWSTDGLGFLEYLQWCEDLGAEAMFVVNCGMSHQESAPLDQMQSWVDGAVNAIEYASGSANTVCGAQRAEHGHPEAFNLRFIEIGNENGMFGTFGGTNQQYTQRYRPMHEAITRHAPGVRTIANTRVDAPVEIVDDHYYNSPGWFWENVHRYDHADRNGPKVYVGEYAVTQGCGTGNLAAALAEGAFMTGLERNSDLVEMASYAPMFVHARDRKWNPDMIVFDGLRSYATPSYWVQHMFANNRTDSILAIDVPLIHDDQPSTGGVGVGSWNTSVEFKDLSVSMAGAPVKLPELGAGVSGLTPNAGEWGVRSGVLGQTKLAENAFALIQAPALHDAGDYTFKLRARRVSGAEGFLILFHARDDANWTWLNVGGWGNTRHALERSVSGMKSQIGASVTGIVENNRWYDVRIELEGRAIRCFLDDSLIIDAIDRSPSLFAAVAGRVTSTEEVIIKAANASASPVRASLVLDGLANTTRTGWAGSVTVLTSPSLADENSFATPRKIVPVSLPFRTPSRELEHEFPARSLTVLRIKPRD